jgi:hypothetical protein
MTPQAVQEKEHNDLRLEVKKLICGLDLDGNRAVLREELSGRLGKTVSEQTLSMALRGYRTTQPYAEILKKLKDILVDGEFIHRIMEKNN